MSMFSPIPLPSNDNHQFKDVMDYWETLQNRRDQESQFAKNLQNKKEEFAQNFGLNKGYLGLAQQAEGRAQQLMPYIKQQYKDTHGKEASEAEMNAIYNHLIKVQLAKAGMAGGQPGAPGQQQGADQAGGAPNAPQPNQLGQPGAGQIDPGAAAMIKEKTGYDFYAQTPQQKANMQEQAKVDVATRSAQAKSDIKKNQEYLDAGDYVNKFAPNMENIHNVLTKDPYASGNIAGARNLINMGSENQGTLVGNALPFVGSLAKDMSTKGGAVVAKFAQAGKPGPWTSHDTNMALNKNLIEEGINAFNTAKKNYEEGTGKSYPKQMHPFLKKWEKDHVKKVKVKDNVTGKVTEMTQDEFDKLSAS